MKDRFEPRILHSQRPDFPFDRPLQRGGRLGVDGTGVTVAALDSGVDYHHPALRGAYRGEVGADLPSNAVELVFGPAEKAPPFDPNPKYWPVVSFVSYRPVQGYTFDFISGVLYRGLRPMDAAF